MNRREIIKFAALATGAAISLPLMNSLLSGCQPNIADNDADYQLQFFSKEELARLRDLVDLILPKTDSPSASDVGVHRMIDSMVGQVYEKADQDAYKLGFSTLFNHLDQAAENKGFSKLAADKKLALLQQLEAKEKNDLNDIQSAYLELKQQTVAYYLSTEEIAKNYLNYLPVPGKYEACISLADAGGKAWAI